MDVSIIIPVKNDAENLRACLTSIESCDSVGIEYEVLVIDNGSTDNTIAVANDFNVTIFQVPDVTVACLRNLGAKQSVGEILAFIDSDCTVDRDWFRQINGYLTPSNIVCFGSPPLYPEKSTWVQRCWFQVRRYGVNSRWIGEVDWLESMNMFVRRQAFFAVDGFDANLTTCEDYDLCVRIQSEGTIVCDNRIVAFHHGEAENIRRFYQKERWRGISNFESLKRHQFALAEIASVLFPVVQLSVIIFATVMTLLALSNVVVVTKEWWVAAIVVWQLPILLLAMKKCSSGDGSAQVFGLWVLLNTYFFARGVSVFSLRGVI